MYLVSISLCSFPKFRMGGCGLRFLALDPDSPCPAAFTQQYSHDLSGLLISRVTLWLLQVWSTCAVALEIFHYTLKLLLIKYSQASKVTELWEFPIVQSDEYSSEIVPSSLCIETVLAKLRGLYQWVFLYFCHKMMVKIVLSVTNEHNFVSSPRVCVSNYVLWHPVACVSCALMWCCQRMILFR